MLVMLHQQVAFAVDVAGFFQTEELHSVISTEDGELDLIFKI